MGRALRGHGPALPSALIASVAGAAGNRAVQRLVRSSPAAPESLQRAVWKMHLPPKRYRKEGVEYFMRLQREQILLKLEDSGNSKKEAMQRFKQLQKEGSYTKKDALEQALDREESDRRVVDRGARDLASKGYDRTTEKEVASAKRLGAVLAEPVEDPKQLKGIPVDETVYFIAHGSGTTVGGLPAPKLATILGKNLPKGYVGKIKLVSCHSGEAVPDVGIFAANLARLLAGSKRIRPASVDGIVGFGVVSHGRIGAEKPDPDDPSDLNARLRPVADRDLQKIFAKILGAKDEEERQDYQRQYRLLAEQKGYFGKAAKPRFTVNEASSALLAEQKASRRE